jgi:hypothetical protein
VSFTLMCSVPPGDTYVPGAVYVPSLYVAFVEVVVAPEFAFELLGSALVPVADVALQPARAPMSERPAKAAIAVLVRSGCDIVSSSVDAINVVPATLPSPSFVDPLVKEPCVSLTIPHGACANPGRIVFSRFNEN